MNRLFTYICFFCAIIASHLYSETTEVIISTGSNNQCIEKCGDYETAYRYAQSFDKIDQTTYDTWPQALTYYLEAYALDPNRAEPFIRIAQHYCNTGKPKLAYVFAHHACQLPYPNDVSIEQELYDFTRYDILGIAAWYAEAFEEGEHAIRKALEYKPHEQYLKNNLKFYIEHRIQTKKKIVGLIPARNESKIIEQCLHALSLYTDAIVYLDDASDDNSVAIVESVASQYHVEKIIRKHIWKRDEPGDRNTLLAAGREIGGTHFIVIDADEMLTANCYEHDWLRNQINALQPGDRLMLNWIHLWKSPYMYRTDEGWKYRYKDFVFCDDCLCSYNSEFIHTSRTPDNLSGRTRYTDGDYYGMLHFQFMNWHNVVKKQVWYKCLERIRTPDKSCDAINQRYAFSMDIRREQTSPVYNIWFDEYNFFDPTVFDTQEEWRAVQIKQWMHQYGIQYFYGLDFWGLDINTL
jgi:tetratricopeptide (TPR) repeat protein